MTHEIEFKLLLPGERESVRLARHLAGLGLEQRGPRLQTNRFLDTEARDLGKQRCVLRLREEEGRFLLTAKGATREESFEGASVQHEVEAKLEAEQARRVLAGELDPLVCLRRAHAADAPGFLERLERVVDGRPLAEIGAFTNERTTLGPLRLNSGVELCFELDCTQLPGRVDHELEVEVARGDVTEARAFLETLFAELELPMRRAAPKAQRFFELND